MAITPAEIEALAEKPSSITGDQGSVSLRSVDELLTAQQAIDAASAVTATNEDGGPRSPWRGIRPARVRMPGAQ